MHNTTSSSTHLEASSCDLPFLDGLSDAIGKAVAKHHPEAYQCVWTPEHTLSIMVRCAIDGTTCLSDMVNLSNAQRRRDGQRTHGVGTSTPAQARSRLKAEVLKDTNEGLVKSLQGKKSKQWRWLDLRVVVVDGTTLKMQDTPQNQNAFPQHGKQKAGAGFPIARSVFFICHATQSILDVEYAPWKGKETGEMSLFRVLLGRQKETFDLVLGDRYYSSYFSMALLQRLGKDALFQLHAGRKADFRRGIRLGNGDHIVNWKRPPRPQWMTETEYKSYPSSLQVREVKNLPRKGKKSALVLVTTLLDAEKYSAKHLKELYRERWDVEDAFKNFKSKCGAGFIDARSPAMFETLLWTHILAYNCLRWHISNAAKLYNLKPRVLSFAGASRLFSENRFTMDDCSTKQQLVSLLFDPYHQLIQMKSKCRVGRSYKRVVKGRKHTNYRKSQGHASAHSKAA